MSPAPSPRVRVRFLAFDGEEIGEEHEVPVSELRWWTPMPSIRFYPVRLGMTRDADQALPADCPYYSLNPLRTFVAPVVVLGAVEEEVVVVGDCLGRHSLGGRVLHMPSRPSAPRPRSPPSCSGSPRARAAHRRRRSRSSSSATSSATTAAGTRAR